MASASSLDHKPGALESGHCFSPRDLGQARHLNGDLCLYFHLSGLYGQGQAFFCPILKTFFNLVSDDSGRLQGQRNVVLSSNFEAKGYGLAYVVERLI